MSETLSLATVRVAGLVPERIPHTVAALTKGVTPNMFHKSSVLAAVVCGGVALAGLGLVAWQKSYASGVAAGAQEAREIADQASIESVNHMKQIMLAFHNYHSANGHFPPKAIFGADGKPKLSWRVALLPFLDQAELFQAFHLDEPWDSPHNKALVARMPEVFTTPSSPAGRGTTRIRVFEGPGTMFDANRGIDIQHLTDGTSNTVAIVAALRAVAWTSPGDLPCAKGKPLPDLDIIDERGVLTGLADGSARYVPRGNEALWRMLITPEGAEVVDWSAIPNPLGPQAVRPTSGEKIPLPTASMTPTPTAHPVPVTTISPELDVRLRTIEAKLDWLMRKLETVDKAPATQ